MVMILRPGQRLIVPGMQVYSGRAASGSFVGALDGISNVAAAYSLRRLSGSYSGAAVRVRRSSDSAEQDIGFDVSGDFDSSAFSLFVGAGVGYVRTWYDQSGNERNATQATAGNQPSISIDLNSKYGLNPDGLNDYMTASMTLPQPNTMMVVSSGVFFDKYLFDGGATTTRNGIYGVSGNAFSMFAGSILTTSASGATDRVLTTIFNGSSSRAYVNGASVATGNPGGQSLGGLTLFARFNAAQPANVVCYDFVVLDANINTTDHNTIGSDMATYYGLSWTTVT